MHTPDAPGGLGVPGSGVARALLVAHQDVPDLGRVEQRVVGGQDRAAGQAEDHVRADLLQRPDQGLGAGHPDLARGRRGGGGAGRGPGGARGASQPGGRGTRTRGDVGHRAGGAVGGASGRPGGRGRGAGAGGRRGGARRAGGGRAGARRAGACGGRGGVGGRAGRAAAAWVLADGGLLVAVRVGATRVAAACSAESRCTARATSSGVGPECPRVGEAGFVCSVIRIFPCRRDTPLRVCARAEGH